MPYLGEWITKDDKVKRDSFYRSQGFFYTIEGLSSKTESETIDGTCMGNISRRVAV
jgi:hypothetical protein